MSSEYRIDVKDRTGALVATCTNYSSLTYRKRINEISLGEFTIDGNDPLVDLLDWNYQVEVWRRNLDMGVAWYCDFYGLHRGYVQKNSGGVETYTARMLSQNSLLARRCIGYYAGYANRSKYTTVAPETIAKSLVTYNATASATTGDGRYRNGALSGFAINVDTDQARGTALDWSCANQNLMATLQSLAETAGADFDLVRTGPATWTFYWYPGSLGADLHETVKFALQWGNMADPELTYDRTGEKTVAVTGGQGDGSGRPIVIRTGADYAAANDIETFVNASNYTLTAGLNAAGDSEMYTDRARAALTFKALQTRSCYYGKDYALGNIVSAAYKSFSSAAQKITGVTVGFDGQSAVENIELEVETL